MQVLTVAVAGTMVFESQRYSSRQIDPAPVLALLIVVLASRTDTGLVTDLDRGATKDG